MNLLIVQPYGLAPGHSSAYTRRLCEALIGSGHNVTLLTADGVLDNWDAHVGLAASLKAMPGSKLAAGREPAGSAWHCRMTSLRSSWVVVRRALREAARIRYDAVHFIDSDLLVLHLAMRLERRRMSLFFNINTADLFDSSLARRRLARWKAKLQRFALRSLCARLVAVSSSESVLASLRRELGLEAVLIPWGVDTPATDSKSGARRLLALPEDEPIVLFAGKLRADKGWDVLADSLAHLDAAFRLVFAGYATEAERRELLERVPAQWRERVLLRDQYIPEEDFLRYFRAADAVVLPYKKSFVGDSGVLSIACSQQCPIIASNTGVIAGKVRSGGLGIVVEAEDPAALAEGIRRFLALPDRERSAVARRLRERAQGTSWAEVAHRHAQIYAAAPVRV